MKYMCAGSVHTHLWACGIAPCSLVSVLFVCVHTYLSQAASLLVCHFVHHFYMYITHWFIVLWDV